MSLAFDAISTRQLLDKCSLGLGLWIQHQPYFPIPWLHIDAEIRRHISPLNWNETGPRLRITPYRDASAQSWFRDVTSRLGKGTASAFVTFDVNALTPKAELLEEFGKWIDSVRSDKRPKRGRGGRMPPWHKIRALSAYRLSSAGFSYGQAQAEVDRLKRDREMANHPNLARALPDYSDESDWHAAVRSARVEVREYERKCWGEFGLE